MAHQRADAAQAVLSAVKIFVALLPDHNTRELWPTGLSVDIMLRRPGPTVRPASLPPAGQAGRRQFGSDRGRRRHRRLETLQARSTPGVDYGI